MILWAMIQNKFTKRFLIYVFQGFVFDNMLHWSAKTCDFLYFLHEVLTDVCYAGINIFFSNYPLVFFKLLYIFVECIFEISRIVYVKSCRFEEPMLKLELPYEYQSFENTNDNGITSNFFETVVHGNSP